MQAPEPRDIVWPNVGKSESNRWVRDAFVMGLMGGVLLFWIGESKAPSLHGLLMLMFCTSATVSLLAALLSYREIERVAPWLAKIIDLSPRIRAFVQTTLPSTALIFFNALIPFFLECEPLKLHPHFDAHSSHLIFFLSNQGLAISKVFKRGAGSSTRC